MRYRPTSSLHGLRTRAALCVGACTLILPHVSFAQEETTKPEATPAPTQPAPAQPAPEATPAPTQPAPEAAAGKTAPPPPPGPLSSTPPEATRDAPAPQAKRTKTDHEDIVGAWGIGFIGISPVPLADAAPVGTSEQAGVFPNDHVVVTRVQVPLLGARKWVSRRVAIDVGLGLWFTGGDSSAELGEASVTVDKKSIFAFALQAGVPIVMLDTKHMSFFVVPQVRFGWAKSSVAALYQVYAPPDAELRGARLEVGGRAGAELYFGFIGLPRLALEAGVGLTFTTELASATVANQSISDTTMWLGATSYGDPWNIFSGLVSTAARYYF